MSIAGSRLKLRALPASVIATQNQPLLLPAQALRAMCSITLVMENKCSLSIRNIFLLAVSYSSAAAFHVHDQPHHWRQDPLGDRFAPPIGAGMSRALLALPPGYPRSGGKAQSARDPPELPARGRRPIPVARSALMAKSKNNPDGWSIPLM
jgi:hypothetical protein